MRKRRRRFVLPTSASGTGEDVGEALLEVEERSLNPAVAEGGKAGRDGKGSRHAEEIASQARGLMGNGVVGDHQAEDVEDVKTIGNAPQIHERPSPYLPDPGKDGPAHAFTFRHFAKCGRMGATVHFPPFGASGQMGTTRLAMLAIENPERREEERNGADGHDEVADKNARN